MSLRSGTARTVAFLAIAVLSIGAAAAAEEARRVAYLSTLAIAEANARIVAIEKALTARAAPRIEYRTFRYELPVSETSSRGEPVPEAARRNADIAARNDAEITRMLAWRPDVILAPGALPAKAAARRTAAVPIVFACKCNPLPDGFGLVRNTERPEANVTGFTRYLIDSPDPARNDRLNLHEKRIELLREFVKPRTLVRLAAIHGDAYDERKWRYEERAARMGVEWVPLRLAEDTIDRLPELLRDARVEAGLVLADTFLDKHTRRLAKRAADTPIPVLFPWDEADLGAWMHYGTVVNIPEMAAEYIHKLLSGARVADLPVRFPDKTEFAFNVKTAKSHGWAPPAPGSRPVSFEAEVDRWIVE